MSIIKSTLKPISTGIALAVLLTFYWTTRVRADSQIATDFDPPSGQDAPQGGTVGGGSRPVNMACLSNRAATLGTLTALSSRRHLGLTRLAHPNFWVYKPQTTAQTAEFSLFDEQRKGIYQGNLPVPKQAGLVSIHLPDTAPPLAKNQSYNWTLALVCNPTDRTEDWVVGGWIERIEPTDNLKQQIANAPAAERISLYARQGFWYDALNTLVELQRTQPSNPTLNTTWAKLLKSGGLGVIATRFQ